MKTEHDTLAFPRITRREGLLTLLASAMALAGCGGGGGGGVGGGGTGSFSAGPIAGFGSIIVNGIRFDDSTARVLDDDGAAHNRSELKLGMMVRVKGKANSRKADNTDDADEITFGSELLGPIDSIPTPQTLLVLGQTVQITASTIFEDGLTLAALLPGDIVEVHGFVDPVTNVINATRIESKVLANVRAFKLQGKISELTATTFQIGEIGGLTISFTPSVDKPASLVLANGLLVRVRLAITPPIAGVRTATKIRDVKDEIEDHDEAEVEGTVTAFTSLTKFSVNGLPVDASGSGVIVPAGLAVGVQVEVEGRLVNGVLVAKTVKLEDENEEREFELHGTVSLSALTSFTLTSAGGVVVKVTFTTGVVRFDDGLTATSLSNGLKLEVRGVALPDGTIKATRIGLD